MATYALLPATPYVNCVYHPGIVLGCAPPYSIAPDPAYDFLKLHQTAGGTPPTNFPHSSQPIPTNGLTNMDFMTSLFYTYAPPSSSIVYQLCNEFQLPTNSNMAVLAGASTSDFSLSIRKECATSTLSSSSLNIRCSKESVRGKTTKTWIENLSTSRNGNIRKTKRKVSSSVENMELDDGDGGSTESSGDKMAEEGSVKRRGYPLYCSVCKVNLNAQNQAEQHYTGKHHARRCKMLALDSTCMTTSPAILSDSVKIARLQESLLPNSSDCQLLTTFERGLQSTEVVSSARLRVPDNPDESATPPMNGPSIEPLHPGDDSSVSTTTRDDDPSHPSSNPPGNGEISCDVYCRLCAVSFNSTKQARQHYHGKSHAKRSRSTNNRQNGCHSSNTTDPDAMLTSHRDSIYTCLVCNLKPNRTNDRQMCGRLVHARKPSLFKKNSDLVHS